MMEADKSQLGKDHRDHNFRPESMGAKISGRQCDAKQDVCIAFKCLFPVFTSEKPGSSIHSIVIHLFSPAVHVK